MICFRDMCFCTFYDTCVRGHECPRALTEEVLEAADKWSEQMNIGDAPIDFYADQPSCYKKGVPNEPREVQEDL